MPIVGRITYIVLVQTLNHPQSLNQSIVFTFFLYFCTIL